MRLLADANVRCFKHGNHATADRSGDMLKVAAGKSKREESKELCTNHIVMACTEDNRIFELEKMNALDLLVYRVRDERSILSYPQFVKTTYFRCLPDTESVFKRPF